MPLRGDFGISFRNQQDVFQLIAERMPATLELVLVATLLSLAVGIPLGVYTAIRRNAPAAQALQFLSVVGVSLPSFAVGILLILALLGDAALAAGLRARRRGPARLVVDRLPHAVGARRAGAARASRSRCSRSRW